MRRISELQWGLIFLVSSIWMCFVSIFKFIVYITFMQLVLFDWTELLWLIVNLGVTLLFFGAGIYSFNLHKKDPMGKKTNELWIKIVLIVFLAYSVYALYLSIDVLIQWA